MRTIKLVGLQRVEAIRVFPLIPSLVDMRDVTPVISVRGNKKVSRCSPEVIYYKVMLRICQVSYDTLLPYVPASVESG